MLACVFYCHECNNTDKNLQGLTILDTTIATPNKAHEHWHLMLLYIISYAHQYSICVLRINTDMQRIKVWVSKSSINSATYITVNPLVSCITHSEGGMLVQRVR